jgi:hypothetical protein
MDPIIESHLNLEHAGKEEEFKDSCILCKNFLEGASVKGADLGVNLSDSASTKDIFGG